ncbi:Z1 domain-containing protein [Phenylobacterium sp. LjRoot164]|uniref:Z1 domain-containing protein n=1 Tax=unclassified Phenylobacterium TaxID=2640670 RepID=UPI003ECDF249
MSIVRILATPPQAAHWTDRLDVADWPGWTRLEQALIGGGKWKPDQVASLASESLRVLRHLRDPLANDRFEGRGLVVGYVQSGKTANYTAVAARAVDAGYRMVIVLSGIHDALRNQTQVRLERELVGLEPGEASPDGWTLLTNAHQDFQGADPAVLDLGGAFLLVVKKNVAILEKLNAWLTAAGPRLAAIPTLVIDDEADQASINTRGNRPEDPAVDEDDEPVSVRPGRNGPSATNALIRGTLSLLPKSTYVAYTATPFANILIDPQATDRRVGKDLFPSDFALQLARPEGYTGTEELFGVSAQGRDVLRPVPDADVGLLRRTRARRSAAVTASVAQELLPESLSDAFLTFCLAGSIREQRPELAGRPHTMLVHVSARTDDQARIAGAIREQRDIWREAVLQGHDLSPMFGDVLDRHLAGVESPADRASLIDGALRVMRTLEVLELNSVTGENLEYESRPGRHLVAVGGNRLSRGLTLEGLTVSYFLRTATMADTLLQMARWYGFRTGYEDLIRVWTTDGIAQWFTELALVEQSLRDALRALARAGRRPDEMAIRLRAHSGLLLTARNKASMADEVQESWSGEHPQTVMLPLQDAPRLTYNRQLADGFLGSIGPGGATTGGWLIRDIPPEVICEFLRRYRTHDDVVAFRGDPLADWIMGRVAADELTDWSVFLAGAQQGAKVELGGMTTGLVTRKATSSQGIGILIDPRHEGVDLPGGPEAFVRASGNFDTEAMRAARPPTQGLLLIYPLNPEPLGVIATDTVIGLALSLPRTSDGAGSAIVNRGVIDG